MGGRELCFMHSDQGNSLKGQEDKLITEEDKGAARQRSGAKASRRERAVQIKALEAQTWRFREQKQRGIWLSPVTGNWGVSREPVSALQSRERASALCRSLTEQVACEGVGGVENYMEVKWVYSDVGGSGWRQERIIIKIIYKTNIYSSLIAFRHEKACLTPFKPLHPLLFLDFPYFGRDEGGHGRFETC